MQFLEGSGWKACFDEDRKLYTAKTSVPGAFNLYEIDADTYKTLSGRSLSDDEAYCMIHDKGRHLYMDVDDRCGPPYTVVFDDDYKALCPWTNVPGGENIWPEELTDAAVELFDSEKNNREQRRAKQKKRKTKPKSDNGELK